MLNKTSVEQHYGLLTPLEDGAAANEVGHNVDELHDECRFAATDDCLRGVLCRANVSIHFQILRQMSIVRDSMSALEIHEK